MIVGIDLGTTNSLIAAFREGQAQLIANALGSELTPSVVGMDDDGQILVGMAARERLVTHPELTTAAFKRFMGTDRKVRLGKQEFRAEELSAFVLRSLKADAEARFGESVEEAVVTVPAYFNDAQRKATRAACVLAGLKVERLLNEPTAAALAYGLHQRDLESKFLVFDLGGGTFDVSLLELFEGVFEVRATAGDNFLGGEDFVDLIVGAFVEATDTRKESSPSFRALVRDRAERAKRALSKQSSCDMQMVWQGKELKLHLDEERFLTLASPLIERLRAPVERALRDARIRARDLNEILLIGGATRMPVVRRMVAQMFGRIPASNIDPDTTVCLGAAVQAGLKARDQALNELVMTDVAPYSLGVSVATQVAEKEYESGRFLPLIERNTVIPASRVETVSPIHEKQTVIDVEVYQGESRLVVNNILLGKLRVDLPSGKNWAERAVDIRFTYDINGILEVEVKPQNSAITKRMVIEGNPGVLTPEQIEQRLADLATLKVHPRAQSENRAALARAERLFEESLGEARAHLARWIEQFQRLLAEQDPRAIERGRQQFLQLLDQIEGEPYV